MLSIVLPAYNEEKMIETVVITLQQLLTKHKIEYELIFVDDGSKDGTWKKIQQVTDQYNHVVGIQFSRNFGKESAIFAGLERANGEVVAVMDCDLQHPPETLIEMYDAWCDGFELIEGVKKHRGKESIMHKISAKTFYNIMSKATGIDMKNASDFKMMDRKVVDSLLKLPERNTFFRALSSWCGYKVKIVEFEVAKRQIGETKWSMSSLIRYALNNIVSFTTIPLQFVTFSGIIFLLVAIILGIQTLVRYFCHGAVEGFTTVILLLLFIGSVIMISLGIIGYYIAKMYEEIKHRPRYIVSHIVVSKEKMIQEKDLR